MEQVFLTREKPAIDSVIDYLFNQYNKNDVWNMSNVLLVVPSARVRIETLEQILIRANGIRENNANFVWEIPQIVTIGRAPEYFYRQIRPLADEFTQYLAWSEAVETLNQEILKKPKQYAYWLEADPASPSKRRNKFLPFPPGKDDLSEQILFGRMLGILHDNLAAEMFSFADVAQKLSEFQNDSSMNFGKLNLKNEIYRWEYLSKVETTYLSILLSYNLWDRQAARQYALKSPQTGRNGFPGDFETNLDIVLAGIVDLNKIQKEMLKRVDENLQRSKKHVTALIYAPQSESKGFDKFGALDVDYWSDDLRCPLDEKQIVQVEKPEEQVLCAFNFIKGVSSDYSPDQITIGAPDEKLVPYIQSTADKLGLQIDNTIGMPLSSTAPGALLSAIVNFIEMHDFASFANLVRHPSVYDAISAATDERGQKIIPDASVEIISILDSYQQNNFPLDVLSGFIVNPFNDEQDVIKKTLDWVLKWLYDLNKPEIVPKEMRQIIAKIFQPLPKDRFVLNRNAQAILINLAGKLETLPQSLTGKLSPVSALKLINMYADSYTLPNGLEEVNNDDVYTDDLESAAASKPMIHVAPWLELVWDSAPVLAILSFNEGIVPQSVNAHLFLPNELRKALQITDNNRRFARDAYALRAIKSSKERLLAICGKVDTEGKPALPSRLLFNRGEEKDKMATFAAQAFHFFNPKEPLPKFTLEEQINNNSETLAKYIDWAKNNLSGGALRGVLREVSATKLQSYIQCPFRFYLQYVLNVQPIDYAIDEMSSLSFGSFIHLVLQKWAQDEIDNGQTDWRNNAEGLSEALNAIVDKQFKRFPQSVLPGIAIQKEIIKQRLRAFADFQSNWNGELIAVEQEFDQVVKINNSDNETITLKGKIDRIDRLPDGTIILLDYKTSEKGVDPRYDHQDSDGQWVKLQLPVYRQIISANRRKLDWIGKNAEIQVGYINISNNSTAELKNPCVKLEGDKSQRAIWDESVFTLASQLTTDIVTNIYNGVFWPPTPTKDIDHDDYENIVSWLERMKDDWE
ncbi:MAG: PD-(D/E)XK nuclease family protein [Thermoguttaceae bacterium]|nr:PD-(D/E)XK nuclease family protein [Thermoguttaceae bacterium]